MSALHGAARRLAGLLNDAQAAGVEIHRGADDYSEAFVVQGGELRGDSLRLTVSRNKAGKWGVEDA